MKSKNFPACSDDHSLWVNSHKWRDTDKPLTISHTRMWITHWNTENHHLHWLGWLCMIPELWIVPEMLVIVGEKMQNWLSFLFDWEKNVKLNSRSYVKIYISMKLTADMKVVGPKKEKKRDEKKKKTFAFGWRRHCFKNCKTLYWKRSIQYLSFCFLTVKDRWNDWSDCIKLVIEKAMEPQFNGKCLI